MSSFLVNAPDGKSVAVATQYGIQHFTHGAILQNIEHIAIYHPNIFIPTIDAFAQSTIVEEPTPELLLEDAPKEQVKTEPKKKAPAKKPVAKKPAPKKK